MAVSRLANLSALPDAAIDAVEAVLKGKTLLDADAALAVTRSLPHGHVALVAAQAARLSLPQLLGPPCRERDLAYALIVSRVVRPRPKSATLPWWEDVTLGPDLGVAGASRDEVYAAMDWLHARQDAIEAELARRHLRGDDQRGAMAMFDLSSSWVEGSCCPLAGRGYSRDGRKGTLQIEYGLLTDPVGRPVAIRVFPGNTADPAGPGGAETFVVVRARESLRTWRRGSASRQRTRVETRRYVAGEFERARSGPVSGRAPGTGDPGQLHRWAIGDRRS